MSDNEILPRMTPCPMCGSEIPVTATRCWLCGETQPGMIRPGPRLFESQTERTLKLVSSIVILLTVGLVWLGVMVEAPGLGIVLLLILIAPLIRTTYVMSERYQQQKGTSNIEMVFMFSTSLVMTLALLTVVGVVAFGTFCLTCIMAVEGSPGRGNEEAAMIFAGMATLAVVVGLIWVLWRSVVSRRIRKDIEK